MPARLVYAPKAYVFTKNSAGEVLNVSDYVVAGQVQRLIDQVSSAEVSLRNPMKRFTTPSQGVAFHPMDAITIFLERLQGFPVQVFTGFLDETPYYQMYPGTITLRASCTLKRLIYTYFDPSLPYVNAFLNKLGWVNDNGTLRNLTALGNQKTVAQGKSKALHDGSIAKLLWAVLTDIAQWQDTNIWIENLPSGDQGIAARMAALMATLATDEKQAADEFTAFMQAVIGGSQGSGGTAGAPGVAGPTGATGNVTDISKIVPTMMAIANNYGLPPLFVVTVWLAEGQITDATPNSSGAVGYFQFTSSDPYPGIHVNYPKDATDLGIATNAFCRAAKETATNGRSNVSGSIPAGFNMNDQNQWERWAETVQNPGSGAYSSYWAGTVTRAQQLINQYGKGAPIGASGSSTTTPATSGGHRQHAVGPSRGRLRSAVGGNTGGGTTTASGPQQGSALIATLMPPGVKGTLERVDMGVDFAMPDGTPLRSLASGQCVAITGNFAGQPAIYIKFDQPLNGYEGMYVAEGVRPTVSQGQRVGQGQQIAVIENHGTGIECGFTHGGSSPAAYSHYTEGAYTQEGQDFAHALGVPALHSGSSQPFTVSGTPLVGPAGSGGAATTGAGGTASTNSNAEAFTAALNFPSVQDSVTAIILGTAHKGFMHDQQLLPFVQQLSQASLRSFQSLPNGDFFAFYPDYFGETNHRKAYWEVHDIEILNGGINLSDSSLVTHSYAIGDNTYPANDELVNMLFSSGTIDIFNAFIDPGLITRTNKTAAKDFKASGGMADIMTQFEAIEFVKRYGARPLVTNFPMVRSPLYEMFLAYQQFMLAWANQFQTPFQFTFMPEIFPGGKVAFPEHGLQMYVSSVTHSWNYEEGGFTTQAVLTAPSALPGTTNPDLPDNMVQALVEPVRAIAAKAEKKAGKPKKGKPQKTVGDQTKQTGSTITQSTTGLAQKILGSL